MTNLRIDTQSSGTSPPSGSLADCIASHRSFSRGSRASAQKTSCQTKRFCFLPRRSVISPRRLLENPGCWSPMPWTTSSPILSVVAIGVGFRWVVDDAAACGGKGAWLFVPGQLGGVELLDLQGRAVRLPLRALVG